MYMYILMYMPVAHERVHERSLTYAAVRFLTCFCRGYLNNEICAYVRVCVCVNVRVCVFVCVLCVLCVLGVLWQDPMRSSLQSRHLYVYINVHASCTRACLRT